MSFFAGSSCVTISGGTFTNVNPPTRDAGRSSSRNSHGLMIVQADEVDLHKEIISGNRYRIYSAFHGGRFVAVKTFEGPRAEQDWETDMALSRKVFHPNVLRIGGVSDEDSEIHFVLFHGITSEQKMQSLIAKALRTDLNTSVQLSMRAVKGIAAGLSYLKSRNIPMHAGRNFDIFIGHENEPIISFHPSDTGSISQNFDIGTGDCGIEILNRLCQQLFSGANSILYEFDAQDREGHPTVTLEDAEGTSNLSESEAILNPSSSTEKSKLSPIPRREVWWLDLGTANQCLESVKRCFEDCLDRFPTLSSSNSLLRRIRSPKDHSLRRNLHQCPGYLREEITLTSDVSRSAIVSHAFPSQSELCSICGQLVQYAYSDPYITDEEMDWGEDGPSDFSVSDDDGRHDVDFGVSPSLWPFSPVSAWSYMWKEADNSTALEMDSVNGQASTTQNMVQNSQRLYEPQQASSSSRSAHRTEAWGPQVGHQPNTPGMSYESGTVKCSALLINTNVVRPRIYEANISPYSAGSSIMQTAMEYDPYSSMFFLNSPISYSKGAFITPDSTVTAVGEDKEMASPSTRSST